MSTVGRENIGIIDFMIYRDYFHNKCFSSILIFAEPYKYQHDSLDHFIKL